MKTSVHGIHHVTCIAGDAQQNLDFYVGVMGMRLVKRSVNQDAPDTYHLFYADGAGTPGTDLTFFPWPNMEPARPGTGITMEVALAVPAGSLSYWRPRLAENSVPHGAQDGVQNGAQDGEAQLRFGETTLPFTDPHNLRLALVETDDGRPFIPWLESPVPPEFQVRGMHSVRLWERSLSPTAALLTEQMGFTLLGTEDGWHRYGVEEGGSGKLIEVKEMPDERRGQWGTGGVHHVAWRTSDASEEMALRAVIARTGLQPTSLIDRFWFQSVYFKEPGGVLFELATDGPGFGVDEDMEHLGEQLVLPPWLEPHRSEIEAGLPPLRLPSPQG
jgi:glyoxalase family protein